VEYGVLFEYEAAAWAGTAGGVGDGKRRWLVR